MKETEAESVIKIMLTAGDCRSCAAQLINQFVKQFGFWELAKRLYREEFGEVCLSILQPIPKGYEFTDFGPRTS